MELSKIGTLVYEFTLTRLSVSPEELVGELGTSRESIAAGCRELMALDLLRPVPGKPGELSAVNPLSAATQLLAPMRDGLASYQEHIDRLRHMMDSLLDLYSNSNVYQSRLEAVETLSTLDSARQTIHELAAHCTVEVLTCQPGGGRPSHVLEEAVTRDEDMLRRGIKMRTIYQHTALFSQATAAYVERVGALGAQVRTSGAPLIRLLAFDQSTAVISSQDDPMAAIVVRDPSIVRFIVSVFEYMWVDADPFPVETRKEEARAVTDKHKATIIRKLVDGATDDVIARELGMSVRTCRRHIAEIMKEIGAKTRMNAGYLLGLRANR